MSDWVKDVYRDVGQSYHEPIIEDLVQNKDDIKGLIVITLTKNNSTTAVHSGIPYILLMGAMHMAQEMFRAEVEGPDNAEECTSTHGSDE